jgi:ESS family glutamate:Na+ symporter
MITRITTSVPFWDFDFYWAWIIQFALVMGIVLLSNILRRRVRWLQASLLPVAVIGGFLGLFLKYLFIEDSAISIANLTIAGSSLFDKDVFTLFTYHAIAIGFGALTLKGIDRLEGGPVRQKPRAVKSGMVIVNSYVLQGIFGILVTIIFSFIFTSIPNYVGFLLPMGYGQGPGQALNVGVVFQANGFTFGADFGLAIASIGFLSASIGGIIYLRKLKKLGKLKSAETSMLEASEEQTILEGNGQIPVVDAVDKLTIQIAIIFLVYGLSWLILFGLEQWIRLSDIAPSDPDYPGFLTRNIIPLLYGFNFIIVVFVAMLYKVISRTLLKTGLMKRIYTNDFLLNRIAGLAFDIMMIASIMAIDITLIGDPGFLITLLVLVIGGGILTYQYLSLIIPKVYPGYADEAWLVFYGTMTGTASTGVALLREKDPYFKTPAANDIVYGSSMAIPLGFPLLLFVGVVSQGWIPLIIVLLVLSIIFAIYHYFLMKITKKQKL